jgi:hypothetical protein
MKLLCKYQESSFLDNQDGWRIAYKQRSTTSRHAVRQKREELEFASPMNHNSSIKDQQKSREVDGRRACNCSYPHL